MPVQEVTRLPVNQAGMALPDPTLFAPENCMESCNVTGPLVEALLGYMEFCYGYHALLLKNGMADIWQRNNLTVK